MIRLLSTNFNQYHRLNSSNIFRCKCIQLIILGGTSMFSWLLQVYFYVNSMHRSNLRQRELFSGTTFHFYIRTHKHTHQYYSKPENFNKSSIIGISFFLKKNLNITFRSTTMIVYYQIYALFLLITYILDCGCVLIINSSLFFRFFFFYFFRHVKMFSELISTHIK